MSNLRGLRRDYRRLFRQLTTKAPKRLASPLTLFLYRRKKSVMFMSSSEQITPFFRGSFAAQPGS